MDDEAAGHPEPARHRQDRKSTRLNSSHSQISYAVFCLKKKKRIRTHSGVVYGLTYVRSNPRTQSYAGNTIAYFAPVTERPWLYLRVAISPYAEQAFPHS